MTRTLSCTFVSCLVLSASPAHAADMSFGTQTTAASASSSDRVLMRVGQCPVEHCGQNARVAGSLAINTVGAAPAEGLRFVGAFDREGFPIQVWFEGNSLRGLDDQDRLLGGDNLVGAELVLQDIETFQMTTIYIDAIDMAGADSWVTPGVSYETYQLTFTDAETQVRQPLCGPSPWNDGDFDHMAEPPALVAAHEAYDWFGDTLIESGTPEAPQWGTIGCLGGAYAKKILLGYGPETVSYEDNEAMVRMLTGRYCAGTDSHPGANFTATGTSVYWQNRMGWFAPPPGLQIEAMWDESGAGCLNEPRHATRGEVLDACGEIPWCDGPGIDPGDFHLVSYND